MSVKVFKYTFGLSLLGALLLVCLLQSEYLWLPASLEPVGRVVYRLAYFAVLPVRAIVLPFIPPVDHHWPLSHFVVSCFAAPFLAYALFRLCRRFARKIKAVKAHPHSPSKPVLDRRQFLLRSTAGTVGLASMGMGGYASLVAPARLKVRHYDIPIRDLPEVFDGLRILHLSDTHYGPYVSRRYLEDVIRQANALDPDVVALTGDYVHFTPRSIEPGIAVFSELRPRHGTVAVLGNHEHWEGAEACRKAFSRIGIPLVDNARLFLTPEGLTACGDASATICLAGVGDLWEDEVSFDRALAGVRAEVPRVLLAHNPEVAEILEPHHRVDLMLSGHTHGGQVAVPVIGPLVAHSALMRKYLGGRISCSRIPVVVSRGVGVAGIPIRFGVPPEIGAITLRKA